jgi:CHASE3 domain sensor protein
MLAGMTPDIFAEVRKIVFLLAGALAIMGAMMGAGWWSVNNTVGTFRRVEHTHQVLYELASVLTQVISIQSGARGFGLTGDKQFLEPYDTGLLEVQHSIGRLRGLLADNPRQMIRLRRLASLVDEEVAVMQQRLAARHAGGLNAASASTADGRGRKVVGEIRASVQGMQQEERDLLAGRSGDAIMRAWLTLFVAGSAAVAVVVLLLVAIRRVRTLPVAFNRARPA